MKATNVLLGVLLLVGMFGCGMYADHATNAYHGIVELATAAESEAGTATDLVLTPDGGRAAFVVFTEKDISTASPSGGSGTVYSGPPVFEDFHGYMEIVNCSGTPTITMQVKKGGSTIVQTLVNTTGTSRIPIYLENSDTVEFSFSGSCSSGTSSLRVEGFETILL